jgi:hypothetical protein
VLVGFKEEHGGSANIFLASDFMVIRKQAPGDRHMTITGKIDRCRSYTPGIKF